MDYYVSAAETRPQQGGAVPGSMSGSYDQIPVRRGGRRTDSRHGGRRGSGLRCRPRDTERIIVVIATWMRAGLAAAQDDDNAVSGQTVLRTAAYSRVAHLP
jgi:hypothetical protein